MSWLLINKISNTFNISYVVINSWFEHKKFENENEAFEFFERNKDWKKLDKIEKN